MEESQPLRRSTRNSVALKNEELTPRKRKVSTPVKVVEPSTPSRRTRASSATPKKNLIEVLNTPKKTLPVLNEEESTTTSIRTPIKKSKEISPKTPSRRRIVKESVSTPKSTRKTVDTSEEINVSIFYTIVFIIVLQYNFVYPDYPGSKAFRIIWKYR